MENARLPASQHARHPVLLEIRVVRIRNNSYEYECVGEQR